MWLKQNKEIFFKKMQQEADAYRAMCAIVKDTVIPSIMAFDGKVLNKRLYKPIEDREILASFDTSLDGTKTLKVTYNPSTLTWEQRIVMKVKLCLTPEYRLDAKKTLEESDLLEYVVKYEQEALYCDDVRKNFNKYLKKAERMERELKAWGKVHWRFRKNVNLSDRWAVN